MLRSTLIYAPAVLMPRLAALVSLIIMTRLLSQADYGLLVLTVTVGEMADAALSGWARISLLRLGSATRISTGAIALAARVSAATSLAAVATAAIGGIVLVPDHPAAFALATASYVANNTVNRLALSVLQIEERRALFSLLESGRAIGIVLVPTLVVLFWMPSFLAASLSGSIVTGLFGIVALRCAVAGATSGAAPFTAGDLFRFAGPFILLAFLAYGIGSIDRVMLKALQDAAAVGVYAAAFVLAAQPLDAIGNAINLQAFPRIVARYDRDGPDGAARDAAQGIELLLKLALPCAGLLVVLRGEIAELLLPASYHDIAVAVMPVIAGGAVCVQLKYFGFDNVFHAARRNWLQSASLAPAFIVAVAVGLLAIPAWGPLGAAMSYAASAFTGVLGSALLGRRIVRVSLSPREIGKAVLSAGMTMLAASAVIAAAPALPLHGTLVVALFAGGMAFLLGNALLHWPDTRRALHALRRHG